MKYRTIEIKVIEFNDFYELPPQDQKLLASAREAGKSAYAAYSGFKVGAAVLLENEIIITGNNQENAAFPSGLCAERVALFYAAANYPGIPVKALAVSNAGNEGTVSEMIKPCGACLQVLSEYEDLAGSPVRIILDGSKTVSVLEGVDNLLPFRFKKRDL